MTMTKKNSNETKVQAIIECQKRYENLMAGKSHFINEKKFHQIPRFDANKLMFGKFLGKGGYCSVYSISEMKSNTTKDEIFMNDERRLPSKDSEENEIAIHCNKEKLGHFRYVLKCLKKDLITEPKRFKIGAADLVTEAVFLSSLNHPNIIKIHGISSKGFHGCMSIYGAEHFLVMDMLKETLGEKIIEWDHEINSKHIFKNVFVRHDKNHFVGRLNVAHDIASAMSYLHKLNIIYRDLKPDNIGFTYDNKVQIFDFGLSKELLVEDILSDGTYSLSGKTGSLRYMAPEVAKCKPYNLSADVYSFGTLLWEICSLKKPYGNYSYEDFLINVLYDEEKLKIPLIWPYSIRKMLKRCFSSDMWKRPSFKEIETILNRECCNNTSSNAKNPGAFTISMKNRVRKATAA